MISHNELIEQADALNRQLNEARLRLTSIEQAREQQARAVLQMEGALTMVQKLLAGSHDAERAAARATNHPEAIPLDGQA